MPRSQALAARQPVLMVFEDAHWSDPSSRDLFDLIVDRVSTLRVLVIVTFRPEFAPPWVGRPHVTLLSLNRLRPRQRAEMISRVTGGKALPEEIADQIIDRTDGVPLFVEELTKAVVESGVLVDAGDRCDNGRARCRRSPSRRRCTPRCWRGSIAWRRHARWRRSARRSVVSSRMS